MTAAVRRVVLAALAAGASFRAAVCVGVPAGQMRRCSAHLLAATPTAHWLEYVDWANAFLTEPLRIVEGYAMPSDRPGNGLEWDAGLVKRYAMQ